MNITTHTIPFDERELADRIQRRHETAQAALARFGGNRLALIAALSRHARTARIASPDAPMTSPAASVRSRDGRAAIVDRPLLAADQTPLDGDRRGTSPVGGAQLAQDGRDVVASGLR